MDVVQERITTEADGPDTVNERLSTGGPGPEGQEDTVREILSGSKGVDGVAEMPGGHASKADWVAYAVSQGADPDEAAAMTKQALIDQYGE